MISVWFPLELCVFASESRGELGDSVTLGLIIVKVCTLQVEIVRDICFVPLQKHKLPRRAPERFEFSRRPLDI